MKEYANPYHRNDCRPYAVRYAANAANPTPYAIGRAYGNSAIGFAFSPIRSNYPRTGREDYNPFRR